MVSRKIIFDLTLDVWGTNVNDCYKLFKPNGGKVENR